MILRRSLLGAWVPLLLAGCGHGSSPPPPILPPPPPPPPVMTIDVRPYLAASRCSDGTFAVLSGCAARSQRASDPMLWRMADQSAHSDGQISDAFASDGGDFYIQTFSYPPHGPFVASHGDGGDVLVGDGPNVRIDFTQNGVPGGTASGYWAGPGCFLGTGWLLFNDAPPTGSWASQVAYLAASRIRGACPPFLNVAFTRWRLEVAAVAFTLPTGAKQTVVLPIIISEHYGAGSIAGSASMERFVRAKGVGRVVWQSFSTAGPSLAFVNPGMSPWTDTPPGFHLKDERLLTKVVAGSGMTGAQFAWPAAGFVP